MKTTTRFAALTLSLTLGTGIATLPLAARASEEGKRNTALALGATAAALLLTQKNKLPGIVAAGAAVVAVTQLGHDRRDRYRHDDGYGYNDNRHHDDYGYGHNGGYDGRNHEDYRGGYSTDGYNADGYNAGYDGRGHDDTHSGGYRYGQNDANRRDDYRDGSNYRDSASHSYDSGGYRVGQNSPNRYGNDNGYGQSNPNRNDVNPNRNDVNGGYAQNGPNRYEDNSRAARSRTVRGFGGTR